MVTAETNESKLMMNEKSDIYSLGLILIELLTGRNPSSETSGGGAGAGGRERTVEWARYCYSDCHVESWVDHHLINQKFMENNNNNNNQRNDIVETMDIALKCTAGDPKERPSAIDVAKMLARLTTTTITCGCS